MRTVTRMNPLAPGQIAAAIALFIVLVMLGNGVLDRHEAEPPFLVVLTFFILATHALVLVGLRLAGPSRLREAIDFGATLSLCLLLAIPVVWDLIHEWPELSGVERVLHSILSLLFALPLFFLADAAWSRFRRTEAASA